MRKVIHRNDVLGSALGVVSAGASAVFLLVAEVSVAVVVLAAITILAYAAYPAMAVVRGTRRMVGTEISLLFMGLALVAVGLAIHSAWIAIALAIHGIIDLAHERWAGRSVTDAPRWYTRFCFIYDWLVGLAILFVLT